MNNNGLTRNRWTEDLLKTALRASPVVVVSGARQTGKTTLVRNAECCRGRKFITFDDLDILDQAKRSPMSLMNDQPITIDEVQRCPEFLLSVKRKVDECRENGMILLTGSANLALMKNVCESLAGRAIYITQPPFCKAEWSGHNYVRTLIDSFFGNDDIDLSYIEGNSDWKSDFLIGGYPPVLTLNGELECKLWQDGYVKTYIERDLRMVSDVSNIIDLQRLMRFVSMRTCRLINQSELARDAGITQPTCHRYLNLLEVGYQIARLKNITLSRSNFLVKSSKLLWTDSGICSILSNIKNSHEVSDRQDVGFFFEQYVYQTLQAWASSNYNATINYWNTKTAEVDFVLTKDNHAVAIEVKLSSQVKSDDLCGIKAFQKSFNHIYKTIRGIVFYTGKSRFLGDNIYAIQVV